MTKSKLISSLLLSFIVLLILGFSNLAEAENKESKQVLEETPFDKVMAVVTHKRCVNCHPAGNAPLQGEDSHLHYFNIQRGPDNQGLAGYTCKTCHTTENNDFSGVPGAPHWGLAPSIMAWQGKTRVEIANQMMNPAKNGGKSPEEILKHLTEDKLVLWAFDPGINSEGIEREKPPIPKEEFIKAVKDWIGNGAVIPNK